MNRTTFLDRDGTIIRYVFYINDLEHVLLLDGVVPALLDLLAHDFMLVVVTNQSGIGRWRVTKPQYDAVNRRMGDLLAVHGIHIEKIYYCPHTPEAQCNCRKPRCGMFYRAADELNIDLRHSLMFGDKDSDLVSCVGAAFKLPQDGGWRHLYPPSHLPLTPPHKTP